MGKRTLVLENSEEAIDDFVKCTEVDDRVEVELKSFSLWLPISVLPILDSTGVKQGDRVSILRLDQGTPSFKVRLLAGSRNGTVRHTGQVPNLSQTDRIRYRDPTQ